MADTSAVAPAPVQSLSSDNINFNNAMAMQTDNITDSISTADVVSARRKRVDEDSVPTEIPQQSQPISAQTQSDVLGLLVA
jgi:hypothetical protein